MSEAAFENVAPAYDRDFTHTLLGQTLRAQVWERLARYVRPEMRVLELNCGTGADAVWLAQQGATVLATDIAPAMLQLTQSKAQAQGIGQRLTTQLLDLTAPPALPAEFQGVFSNFGGLNCVRDLRPLAQRLAAGVAPGGWLLFVVMGPWCVWEVLWYLLHAQPRTAFRRWAAQGAIAQVGTAQLPVWYPPPHRLAQAFAPHFKLQHCTGLGVFLPPSYLERGLMRHPNAWRMLLRLERALAAHWPFWLGADHIILEFTRVDS